MDEVLDYLQENLNEYELASGGKRFANYVIDIAGYLIFSAIIGFVIGIIVVGTEGETYFTQPETIQTRILSWIEGLIVVIAYYTISEYVFKGKTLGKLITRTRAVNENNSRMDLGTCFKRSLCRCIPFEQFTFLSQKPRGWHDDFSGTKVIVDKEWRYYESN
ncbi:MAG: RDD family protein [Bacteroidota bacterium]